MLSIITPCYRQHHLSALHDSIEFDKIHVWIIIYDTSNGRTYPRLYEGTPKIMEIEWNGGISGNPQRNYGMSFVTDGFIYFLDDDNIIHPHFWNTIIELHTDNFYTFDQQRNKNGDILYGNRIEVGYIDTAMFLVHKKHIGALEWITDKYDADGYFICTIAKNHPESHCYINTTACYYNYLA